MARDSKNGWNEVFRFLYEWREEPPNTTSDALRRLRGFPKRVVQKKPLRERNQRDTFAYSALLGLSVIAIVQLAPSTGLDVPLTISVLSFALSIPALTATVYIINASRKANYAYEVETLWTMVMDLAGILFSLVGMAGLFWHLWWAAGILFVIVIIAVFAIFIHYLLTFREINAAEVAQDAGEDNL